MVNARWRVVSDTPKDELTAQSTFRRGREITFELLDNGTVGSVFVPLPNYTADYVQQAIQEYADRIHAVSNLSRE